VLVGLGWDVFVTVTVSMGKVTASVSTELNVDDWVAGGGISTVGVVLKNGNVQPVRMSKNNMNTVAKLNLCAIFPSSGR